MSAATEPEEREETEDKPISDQPYRGDARTKTPRREAPTIWQRATYRWTAITSVLAVLLVIYTQHPYYKGGQFAPWRPYFTAAFVLWLCLGVFYCKATLEKFSGQRYMMRDGGLHLLLLFRAWQKGKFWRIAKNRRVRTTLLGMCVKAFFTPLMTGFISGHMSSIADLWLRHKHLAPLRLPVVNGSVFAQASAFFGYVGSRFGDFIPRGSDFANVFGPWSHGDIRWALDMAYNFVFFIDCGFALIGYSTESRWMGNKTRSVEPTPFGWLVCLACYPPYNNVLGTYLPLDNGPAIITDDGWLLVIKGVTVGLFAIYASATVAFGFKFSNLTNRGIIARGPYRFVRHPAYLTKCSAWWLEHLPTLTIVKAVFLCGLCGVYALRAWTEERHLSQDPDYVAYKKKVPWVLFPGVY